MGLTRREMDEFIELHPQVEKEVSRIVSGIYARNPYLCDYHSGLRFEGTNVCFEIDDSEGDAEEFSVPVEWLFVSDYELDEKLDFCHKAATMRAEQSRNDKYRNWQETRLKAITHEAERLRKALA